MQKNDVSAVEDVVREYPALLDELRSLRSSRSRNSKDPTATAAITKLPQDKQRRLDAVATAYKQTRRLYGDGFQRMLLIAAVYWDAPEEPILKMISAATALDWRKDFLEAVAEELSVRSCFGCVYRRPLFDEGIKACMFCYDTGEPRVYNEDRCFSKKFGGEVSVEKGIENGGGVA